MIRSYFSSILLCCLYTWFILFWKSIKKRDYKVDVGVVYDRSKGSNSPKEIDFVVNDMDRRIYIQSALEMSKDEKAAEELNSFVLTGDFYRKVVIRDDIPHHFFDDKGFLHCSLLDFLLNRVDLF